MTSTDYDSLIGYLQISRGTFTLVQKFSALFKNSVDKCCLHSFYYIFSIYFHCSASIPYPGQKWTDYTRNGTFAPGNEGSWELSFLGAMVPTGNFRCEEQKYRRGKSPDTKFISHYIHSTMLMKSYPVECSHVISSKVVKYIAQLITNYFIHQASFVYWSS